MTPRRLWLWSIALHRRGHKRLARRVRHLNGLLFHNDLGAATVVSPDITLGHRALGLVIHDNVVIGARVKLWHNVTLAVRAKPGSEHRIVIEDDVMIGANAVVITPRFGSVTIGRGAWVGAGAVVTKDVPPGATVVGSPAQVIKVRDGEPTIPSPRNDGTGR